MRLFYSLYTGLVLLLVPCLGQSQQVPSNTTRIVALPDVNITASTSRLVVASGRADTKSWHLTAPGGATAVRFLAPQAQYHELRLVRLHVRDVKHLREGRVQIRIASTTAAGTPTDDNLLPDKLVLSTADLRRASKHTTLQWPTAHLLVPTGGFFIVVECLGQSDDEYTSRILPQEKGSQLQYEIRRRTHPNAPARIAEAHGFPVLRATQPDPSAAESWYRDTVTHEWRRNQAGHATILVEAVFE
jgi:hypothetical protein